MRSALVLAVGGLALAACQPEPAEPAPKAEAAKPPAEWAFGMGKNSVEIVHMVGGDARDADLRMVCAAGDGFLTVLPRVTPIGSEERLSIGAGDAVQALVASPAKTGVQATGPIESDLLTALGSDKPLGFSYGAEAVGPFEPPPALRRAFAEACAKLVKAGAT